MDKNTKQLLNDLLLSYEGSAYFRNEDNGRRVFLNSKRSSLFKKIFISEAYKYKDDALKELKELEKQNFISLVFDRHESLEEIVLNIPNVYELYLKIGRENPKEFLFDLKNYLQSTPRNGVSKLFVDSEVEKIETEFKYSKCYYSSIEELENILNCIDGIYELKEETMERDFSVSILHDSKAFDKLSNKVCAIIKDFAPDIDKDIFERNEDLLASLNIVKNSTYALIKNNLVFKLNDQIIDLNKLGFEYSLDDKMIKKIEILKSNFKRVITVENLTTFHALKDDEALIIYLAGFHNHTKRMLLLKLYKAYPNVKWYHFGDIDVGGFRIFVNLIERTEINFEPYKMGIEELKNNKDRLKPLENNDLKSLLKMVDDPKYDMFKEQIEYMIEHKVKFEQENLD